MKKIIKPILKIFEPAFGLMTKIIAPVPTKNKEKNFHFFYSAFQDRLFQKLYLLGINRTIFFREFFNKNTIILDTYKLDFSNRRIIVKTTLQEDTKNGAIITVEIEGSSSFWSLKKETPEKTTYDKINSILDETIEKILFSFNKINDNFPNPLKATPSFKKDGKKNFIITGENLEINEKFTEADICGIIYEWLTFNNSNYFSQFPKLIIKNISGKYWSATESN